MSERHPEMLMCQADSRAECGNDAHWVPVPGAVSELGALLDRLELCEPDDDEPITWGQLRRQVAAAIEREAGR